MVIRLIIVTSFFLVSLNSQGQFGLGVYSGISSTFGKITIENSPKNTFRYSNTISFPQLKLNISYQNRKNILYINYERNNYFISAADNSKNILFFPELSDGRGVIINNGGKANTFGISFGRQKRIGKWKINASVNLFYSKYKAQYENIWGSLTGSLDSLNNKTWEWSFMEYNKVRYFNSLNTFGIGLISEVKYSLTDNLFISLSNEINKGFIKIIEKDYKTNFINYNEPATSTTYINSISFKGSNYKCYLGIRYYFNKAHNKT